MRYKIINWVLLFLTVLLFVNVIRSFKLLALRGNVVGDIQGKLQEEKDKQDNLKKQLARVESNQYIEKEARNKLNLGREGEMIVLLPSVTPVFLPTPTPVETIANWQKWMRLFL